jgi:flagellar biosynthesis/type III secretory pathway protein FliH
MSSSSDLLARRARLVRHDARTGSALLPELVPEVRPAADHQAQLPDPAYEAGFADGHVAALGEAMRAATADARIARDRADAVAQSLGDALAVVRARHDAELAGMAAEVTEAAMTLAEAIVGRALRDESPAVAAMARALAPVDSGQAAVVRVHPGDLDLVAGIERPDTRVVADETVPPGGCVVDAGASRIDGGFPAAVDRVRAALLETGDEPW